MRDGVIYTRVGKGTFVAEPKIDQQLRALTGFTQDVQARRAAQQPGAGGAHCRGHARRSRLRCAWRPAAEMIKLARLRLADGLPLAIETAFLPLTLCPDLLRHDFRSNPSITCWKRIST